MSVELVKLGDVAGFVRGITYKPSDVLTGNESNAIPCMRTKNIQEYLEDDDLVYIPKKIAPPEKLVRPGDILISSANSWNLVGKCCWIPDLSYAATFGGFTSVLRARHSKIDPRYLYRWFSSPRIQATARSFGQQTTNISNLNHKRCLDLEIPLPPLAEQKRIAAILDKADQLRQKRRQAIALLDSLTQSIFLEMFGDPVSNPKGWQTNDLSDFEAFLTSGSRGWAAYYSDDGRPFIRIQNLKNGKLSTADLVFVSAPDNAEARRTTVYAGDVLISITADLGRIAVVPPALDGGANINQHIALFRPRGINSTYLASYLASAGGSRQFAALNRQGVKAGLNFSDIRRLRIIAPPIELQKRFEQLVISHETQQAHQLIALRESDALFSSLQHRAFSGQL